MDQDELQVRHWLHKSEIYHNALRHATAKILQRAADLRDCADKLEREAERLADQKEPSQAMSEVVNTLENMVRNLNLSDFARYAADLAKGEEL